MEIMGWLIRIAERAYARRLNVSASVSESVRDSSAGAMVTKDRNHVEPVSE
jgi:hypothetical protein